MQSQLITCFLGTATPGRVASKKRSARYVSGTTAAVNSRSACGPGPEFLGVAYGPDVLDPVAGDLEREHGNGDVVLLGDQAGLAVDHALQDRQVRREPGDLEAG